MNNLFQSEFALRYYIMNRSFNEFKPLFTWVLKSSPFPFYPNFGVNFVLYFQHIYLPDDK